METIYYGEVKDPKYLKSSTCIVQLFFTSISETISVTCKSGSHHMEKLAKHSSNMERSTSVFLLYMLEKLISSVKTCSSVYIILVS